MEARFFILFLVFEICYIQLVSGSCDPNYGPAGSPECVLLNPFYSKYQWATCLTNEYIQTVSKGKAICYYHSNTYCYYQCMMEIFEIPDGEVRDECACNETQKNQPRTTNPTQLPSHCYSPSGKDCSWYSDCLERRFPCQQKQETSYAINNGVKFCNLYEEHYKSFSIKGQQWIDAVRRCLQVELVHLLRPFVQITCKEIKQKAFDSHVECYTNPGINAPSYCDLSIMDVLRIAFTVGPELYSRCKLENPSSCNDIIESSNQLMEIISVCKSREKMLSNVNNVQQIQITYHNSNGQPRFRRAIQSTNYYSAGVNIINTIANKMKWKSRGISWIAYMQNNRTTNEQSLIQQLNTLLAPSKLYNLNDKTNISSPVNVTLAVEEVTEAFRNGSLTSDMIDGISIVKYYVCLDNNCSNKSLELEPLPSTLRKDASEKFWSLTNTILISGGCSLFVLISISVIICLRRKNSNKVV